MFLTRREPGVPWSLFRSYPFPFSPPFLVCLFYWSIFAVVSGKAFYLLFSALYLEYPCPFSDLILFPFLLLFFYIVPYPSFSSMSFSLIYICCSFRKGILFAAFPTVAIYVSDPQGTWNALVSFPTLSSSLSCSFSSSLFLNYSSFSSMSFSMIYICCSFRGGILSVVFATVAICFWPAGNLECPCLFSDLILFPFLLLFFYIVPYPSFSSMSCSLIYICCSFRGGILSAVFPAVAISFWPAGNLECPCLFSDLILFPFLLLIFYIVPFPSFSSMSLSLIYICCSFPGGILSVYFAHFSQMFLTRREPGVPLSLFRPYPLPFSPPLLLYCYLAFLFFFVFFIDLYLL